MEKKGKEQIVAEVMKATQSSPMPRRELVAQMINIIKTVQLTHDETMSLYTAITGRMIWKRCHVCLKSKLMLEGKMTFPNGDLSKPKNFVCKDCA